MRLIKDFINQGYPYTDGKEPVARIVILLYGAAIDFFSVLNCFERHCI